jgi:carbon-monoxide dehydrogenase small subunit
MSTRSIRVTVNGQAHEATVDARLTLADLLRDELGLTGTHVGCEHGVCGACTVLVDGQAARACLVLAVQVDGADVTTVEGLAGPEGQLHPIQQAFTDEHALQCGFCTPGFLLAIHELLADRPTPTEDEIRDVLGGQLCRCTGYQGILRAVQVAAVELASTRAADAHG